MGAHRSESPPPPPTRLEQTPPRGVGEDTAGPFPGPPPRYLSGKWVSLCWGRPCFLRWLEELLAEGMCASIAPGLRAAAATSCRALRRSGGGKRGRDELLPGPGPYSPPPPPVPSRTQGRTEAPTTHPSPPRGGCSGLPACSRRAARLLRGCRRLPAGDRAAAVPSPARPSPQPLGRQPARRSRPPPPTISRLRGTGKLSSSGEAGEGGRPCGSPPFPCPGLPRVLTRQSGLLAGSASAAKGVWQRRKLCNYGRGWIAV